jgi:hypothetical protein
MTVIIGKVTLKWKKESSVKWYCMEKLMAGIGFYSFFAMLCDIYYYMYYDRVNIDLKAP